MRLFRRNDSLATHVCSALIMPCLLALAACGGTESRSYNNSNTGTTNCNNINLNITQFTATPAAITAGDPVTLTFSVSGADSIVITNNVTSSSVNFGGLGDVTGNTVNVLPMVTTSYTLTASACNGVVSSAVSRTVTVNPAASGPGSSTGPEDVGEEPQAIEDVLSDLDASPGAICAAPINEANTTSVAPRVGNGTPQSCTQAALQAEITRGGIITFNCGTAPATIRLTSTLQVPANLNTVIDGGGKITLDGNNAVRILNLAQNNYRTNRNGLTLQHIALINGRAPATGFVPQDPNNPRCAYGYPSSGSGGAINVRDARLHVIDVDFRNNAAASPGPDVGGGAIYALGSLDVTIVGSRFLNNTGSNAGAVGFLQTNGGFYNSRFEGNTATGVGMNYVEGDYCPGVGHPGQGGAGGNGGAIAIDGSADETQTFCGTQFIRNKSNELAGAIFRTANRTSRPTRIERSFFQYNSARQGGAFFLSNLNPLDIVSSTFQLNSARTMAAGQIERSRFNIVNSTFAGNSATSGMSGGLFFGKTNDGQSVVRNATFANNRAENGFSAALAGTLNFSVYNSVFSNNIAGDTSAPMQCGFSAIAGANNVQWPRNKVNGGAPDNECVNGILFADPRLGSIGENGGPTPTFVPQANSPLRNAGRDCPSADQRGQARNTAQCTIGAVEP